MKRLILSLLTFMICTSCSKDANKPEIQNDGECKLTELYSGENGERRNFKYDNQGRVIKITVSYYKDGHIIDVLEDHFSYENAKVIVRESYNGKENWKEVYSIENEKITQVYMDMNDGSPTRRKSYQYNQQGYLNKITFTYGNSDPIFTDITYNKGNISAIAVKSPTNSSLIGEYLPVYNALPRFPYSEYLGVMFNDHFLIENGEIALYEQGLFGKKNQNQIISSNNANFSFVSDEDNKPSKMIANSGGHSLTYQYKFECN